MEVVHNLERVQIYEAVGFVKEAEPKIAFAKQTELFLTVS